MSRHLRLLLVCNGKGGEDRIAILPDAAVDPLQRHLAVTRAQHAQAMKRGNSGGEPPFA
jgi:site-specific recombinase XerD